MSVTVNTYARLDQPNQFRPSEAVDVYLHYSYDLLCNFATIKVYDASYEFDDGRIPYKATLYANADGGDRHVKFTIPAYALGDEPYNYEWDSMSYTGKLKARVDMGNTLDEDGNVVETEAVFSSNVIFMPIYLAPEYPLYWGWAREAAHTTDSSVFTESLQYRHYSSISPNGFGDVNSYQYMLYDELENFIWESEIKYDWASAQYAGVDLTFKNLEDGRNYYYKAKATLVGGYNVETELEPLSVNYAETPITSTTLVLANSPKGYINVTANLEGVTHTRIIISRCVKDTNQFLAVKQRNTSANTLSFKDSMVCPNVTYVYKMSVFDGDSLVGTYYNEVTHSLDGMCISDSMGIYQAIASVVKYPISKNARVSFQDTFGNKYTSAFVGGSADYYTSGSAQGTFMETEDECRVTNSDIQAGNISYAQTMLNWLNNGKPKLLKYDDGFSAIVMIDGEPSVSPDDSGKLYTCSFGWKQIADSMDKNNYLELGMVGDV